MTEFHRDTSHIISLIYETAEDAELWPTVLAPCEDSENARHMPTWNATRPSSPTSSQNEGDLSEHMERALRLNLRISAMQDEISSTQGLLNCLPLAIVTLDAQCKIININHHAKEAIANSQVLAVSGDILSACNPSTQRGLKSIVTSALSNEKHDKHHTSSIKLKNVRGEPVSLIAVKTTEETTKHSCCTLFIICSSLTHHISPALLKTVYQLTPAESRLAHALLNGDSLKETAEQLGVTHNTARNQLKAIFAKTGAKRQSELVGLLLSTPSVKPTTEGISTSRVNQHAIQKKQQMQLSDKRTLCYYEFGDPNGKPVMYFHEFMVWQWWLLINTDEFMALGVRLIIPMRPGFMGSDFQAPIDLTTWSKDFDELIHHLNIDNYHILGFSSGGLFALAAAYHFPHRCLGLALVSSSAPLEILSEIKDVQPSMSRLIMGFARFAPRLYRRLLHSLVATVKTNPMNYFRGYFSHWSDYDRQLMANPQVLESISQCFTQTLAEDLRGISSDPIICTQACGFSLNDLPTPTHIWRGEDDKAVPTALADKLSLIPNNHVNVVAKGGHLLIHDYWHDIISALLTLNKTPETKKAP